METLYVLNVMNVSVVIGVQHSLRMRRIVLSFVTCLAMPYFFTLSHTRHFFEKKKKGYWAYGMRFDSILIE